MESPEEFWALHLLDFFEASPMLQVVHVKIIGDIFLDDVPQERVVVLADAESLSLVMSDGEPGYELAAHISCPSAKHTSLTHECEKDAGRMIPEEISMFPASVSWNVIVRHYTRSPVEEVALEMKTLSNFTIECSLTFRSPDATTVSLHFALPAQDEDEYEEYEDRLEVLVQMYWKVFSQACRTIRDLTLLTNIKRLRICHICLVSFHSQTMGATNEVRQLFKSVGPLEELVLHQCDMQAYLASFHHYRGLHDIKEPVVFPPIKELTVSYPVGLGFNFGAAMVKLAESQHVLGVPFECVTVHTSYLPVKMAERLRPWVGAVHCYEEFDPSGKRHVASRA